MTPIPIHPRRLPPALLLPLLLAAALAGCAPRGSYVDLYGQPAPAQAYADQVIQVGPQTRHVNVVGGQVVRFVRGERSFTWHFLVARTVNAFDLTEVAPAGFFDGPVIAYVEPDPRYMRAP